MRASRQQSREPPLAHGSPARFPQLVVLLFLLLWGSLLLRLGLAVPGDDARRCCGLLIAVIILLLLQCTKQELVPSAMLQVWHGSPCSELGQGNGGVLSLSTVNALRGAGKQGSTWASRLRRGSSEALMTTGAAMAVTSASSSSDASSSDSASACFSLYQSGALPGQYRFTAACPTRPFS